MNSPVEIIIIEDNKVVAEIIIKALQKNNLAEHLLHLEDGRDAMDFLFAKGEYEERDLLPSLKLILLDLGLPNVDGLQILKKLKANEATKAIPVVILTISEEEKDMVESYQLGANSFLVKPGDSESFTTAVASVSKYWLQINQAPVAG